MSMIRRINPASGTESPSSLKNLIPAACIDPRSAIDSPRRPRVRAPATRTRQSVTDAARAIAAAAEPPSSTVGTVLGIAITAVYPPEAAALAPDHRSSFHVSPGSLKWTWRSTRPGPSQAPPASSLRAPLPDGVFPTATTVSPSISTDASSTPALRSTMALSMRITCVRPLQTRVPPSAPGHRWPPAAG